MSQSPDDAERTAARNGSTNGKEGGVAEAAGKEGGSPPVALEAAAEKSAAQNADPAPSPGGESTAEPADAKARTTETSSETDRGTTDAEGDGEPDRSPTLGEPVVAAQRLEVENVAAAAKADPQSAPKAAAAATIESAQAPSDDRETPGGADNETPSAAGDGPPPAILEEPVLAAQRLGAAQEAQKAQRAQTAEAPEGSAESGTEPAALGPAKSDARPEAPAAETSGPESAAEPASESAESKDEKGGAAKVAAKSSSETGDGKGEGAAKGATPANGETKAAAEASVLPKNLGPVLAAFETKTPLRGKVIGWNRGGFHVALDDIAAFCPKSQIEIGNPRKSASYVDREFDFRVIEIRNDGKRIVVSRAEALKEERARLRKETRERLSVGAELEGKVSSITDFGAFVDLGGLEGLVHLSQLSRRRVEHASEVLKVGDKVRVRVIKLEKGGSRISLSMKDLEPDPWDGADDRHPTGSPFTGTVLRSADFGIFVEVEPGLEGLVHSSQLPLGVELGHPSLEEGKEVSGWVRDCDPARRRLSLAMREVATEDPWVNLSRRYPEGEEVEGTIEQVAKFGIFVQLEPGLTGLLPFSAMSMSEGSRPQRSFTPGQTIAVQIDSIDERRKRISLAPRGRQLEGTRADFRNYVRKQKKPGRSEGLNAMAAAFEKLKSDEARS